jgi:hypothetical protein
MQTVIIFPAMEQGLMVGQESGRKEERKREKSNAPI